MAVHLRFMLRRGGDAGAQHHRHLRRWESVSKSGMVEGDLKINIILFAAAACSYLEHGLSNTVELQ